MQTTELASPAACGLGQEFTMPSSWVHMNQKATGAGHGSLAACSSQGQLDCLHDDGSA
jgi:hypothetical protein